MYTVQNECSVLLLMSRLSRINIPRRSLDLISDPFSNNKIRDDSHWTPCKLKVYTFEYVEYSGILAGENTFFDPNEDY